MSEEPLKCSGTLFIARLQALAAFVSAFFLALPDAAQLVWLGDYLPGPSAVILFLGFACALAWRRLALDLSDEERGLDDGSD